MVQLGAIADDYTGGADLAGMIAQHGVRTVQFLGVPAESFVREAARRCQAAVVCLKSRAAPAATACALARQALFRLRLLQPAQFQFKYCSTFDSTSKGNIGPVIDALMGELGVDFTVAVPALPANRRTQYLGYLFVGGRLLSESPLRNHPLNPMTEANLVRHLQRQTRRRVGLIALPAVRAGVESIGREIDRLKDEGVEVALVDAIEDRDLETIAEAVLEFRFITGGSGIADKLAALWSRRGMPACGRASGRRPFGGRPGVLLLAGSCSAATLKQIDVYQGLGSPGLRLDPRRLVERGEDEVQRLAGEGLDRLRKRGQVLIYSSAPPSKRSQITDWARRNGVSAVQLAARIETAFREVAARIMADGGVRRLVVAGGETAGAVLDGLNVPALEVLDILDPGVPALRALGDPEMGVVLKSGNFGSLDFFVKAARYLEEL